jgi:hypothetical protein
MRKRILFAVALGLLAMGALHKVPAAVSPDCRNDECRQQKTARPMIGLEEATRRRHLLLRATARQAITSRLRDPGSAIFGDLFVSTKKGEAVCGSFNAKNGLGGYQGLIHFVITTADGILYVGNAARWNAHCAGVVYTAK